MSEFICEILNDVETFSTAIGHGDDSLRYFNHPAWVRLAWEHMEAGKGSRFSGLLVKQRNRVVGWWPLVLSRRTHGYRLQNLGQEVSDYACPHIQSAYHAEATAIFCAMLEQIAGMRTMYAYLQWQQFLVPEGVRLPAFLSQPGTAADGWTTSPANENYYLDCTPYKRSGSEWFSQRLSRNMRKNLRYEHNLLKRVGTPILRRLENRAALEQMRSFYEAWYRYGGANPELLNQKLKLWWSFYEATVNSILEASSLELDGKCISLIFGFRRDNEFDLFSLVFSPDYAQTSPGKQHLVLLIQHEIELGTKRFNFMVGNEPYKQQLSTNSYLSWNVRHTHLDNIHALLPRLKAWLGNLKGNPGD